ncbi:hypothetical protein [Dysgonomonas sp. 520]|uniref:hypothetical protein n=1 Tax=Dysgonomonas sp. 520 TaxID=2302931 RepID=UPI0013D2203A|nr:hypothetical protein [Dysgonomonas sp. 520]NDW08802.1 hypothetical protein [Dysgonomonas sp. 520]
MKKLKFLAGFALVSVLLFSCGNKETKTTSEETKDTTNVSATTTTPEPEVKEEPVEEIALSFTLSKDPCGPGSQKEYLHIKGGKPFEDKAKPYKVEAKNTDKGSVKLGKFVEKDGVCSIEILETMSNDDEVSVKIVVTDANGTEKTITYVIPYCV